VFEFLEIAYRFALQMSNIIVASIMDCQLQNMQEMTPYMRMHIKIMQLLTSINALLSN
jgi:hypothetical protein